MAMTALCLFILLAPAEAAAQNGDLRLQWNESWPDVRTGELVLAGVFTAGLFADDLLFVPDAPRVRGGILLDDAVRDAVSANTRRARLQAAAASDAALLAIVAYPVLMDAVVAAWVVDENERVALQMLGIDFLAFASTNFLLSFTKNFLARLRPYAVECEEDPDYDYNCENPDRFRSFFSGHTANAFTAASLVCLHHANIPLYGGGAADDVACISSLAVATGIGFLRILADKHYLSDVFIGAAIGVLSGLVVPSLLHYGFNYSRAEGREPPF